MSTITSASLLVQCLNPKTLSFHTPKPSSLSLNLHAKPISLSSTTTTTRLFSSRFARRVAVSSDFDVLSGDDGEEGGEDDMEQRSFSPDLKLFVGNLPFNVDSAQLAELFESAGTVEMVEVIYDKTTGRSRGFGFVTMSAPEEVEAAARQFNGYELEGRPLRVNNGPPPPKSERFQSKAPRFGARSDNDGNRLYVGNLSWDVDDVTLNSLFSEVGEVSEARVVCERESGRSRGFGFVSYSSAEDVNSAIESLNGYDLNGRQIRVSVAEAKPRRF